MHLFLLLLTCLFCNTLHARDTKVLVLIIASDNQPVYLELQKLWRSYMHQDRKHIEAYVRETPEWVLDVQRMTRS